MTGYLISAGSNYHWVRSIEASTHGNGVLKLILQGDRDVSDQQFNQAEILIFTDNVDLTNRLVAAINAAATSPAPAVHDEDEPPQLIDDGSCDPLYGQRMDSADMGEN